jgi:hypothetical protein
MLISHDLRKGKTAVAIFSNLCFDLQHIPRQARFLVVYVYVYHNKREGMRIEVSVNFLRFQGIPPGLLKEFKVSGVVHMTIRIAVIGTDNDLCGFHLAKKAI